MRCSVQGTERIREMSHFGSDEGNEQNNKLTSSLLLCFFLVSIAGLIFCPGESGLLTELL
jgi:hypothetical protein